ncbi:hypothetical protein L228DRAFT_8856 [Xylona heveae TC161]|uniref:DUF7603 domain-containing protein n=1 Tax=Xylona heveae (strain CBS 132557 / TC161) TaxID=1328760 RepID=A0A165JI80_XYLHT|nr:hypothetical protein L228DRAFT_8856 [Xylona heveae TC161]KZF26274.1 hypothetical protein L228DRAFT_8856 [Xylona heveae TC161]
MAAEHRPSYPPSTADTAAPDPPYPAVRRSSRQGNQSIGQSDRFERASVAAVRPPTSPAPSYGPVRRKPLPSTASPLATGLSSPTFAEYSGPGERIGAIATARPFSIESLQSRPSSNTTPAWESQPRNPDRLAHGPTPQPGLPLNTSERDSSSFGTEQEGHFANSNYSRSPQARPSYVRLGSDTIIASITSSSSGKQQERARAGGGSRGRSATMSLKSSHQSPQVQLQLDTQSHSRDFSEQLHDQYDESINASKPKSPGQRFTSLFGWGATSPGAESSVTTFSDRSPSPLPSPYSLSSAEDGVHRPGRTPPPHAIDVSRANADSTPSSVAAPTMARLPLTPAMSPQLTEMEDELRQISAELAASIKREMDLEDMVERLQTEVVPAPAADFNRRTSDYFSDSGTSSVRYPLGDSEAKIEALERTQRRVEQEKAMLQADFSHKIQDERAQRSRLEKEIWSLQEQASQNQHSRSDKTVTRVEDLEASLEDVRRRLAEERLVKENFEDLVSALREELEGHRNERDNLREEIVPSLKSQVEGLEAAVAESQKLAYEYTRMQQEMQSLKEENIALSDAKHMQSDLHEQQQRQHQQALQALEQEKKTLIDENGTHVDLKYELERYQGELQSLREENLALSNAGKTVQEGASRSPDEDGENILLALDAEEDAVAVSSEKLHSDLVQRLEHHEQELQALREENEDLRESRVRLQREHEEALYSFREEIEALTMLRETNTNLQEQLEQQQLELRSVREENEALTVASETHTSVHEQLQRQQQELDALQEEKQALISAKEAFTPSDHTEALTLAEQMQETLQGQLHQQEQELQMLKEEKLAFEEARDARSLPDHLDALEVARELQLQLEKQLQQQQREQELLKDQNEALLAAKDRELDLQQQQYQRQHAELRSLQEEHKILANAKRTRAESLQQTQSSSAQRSSINSIAEEGFSQADLHRSRMGLTRSNSLARGTVAGSRAPTKRSSSLTRSSSVREQEPREAANERVKDVEAQRDALHEALKSMIQRQEYQASQSQKRIRALEMERDRALSGSFRRRAYHQEVSVVRREINQLRRRADDALEQKWQCEKGLSGIKIDLDRAEQETGTLRLLLQEQDILNPEQNAKSATLDESQQGSAEEDVDIVASSQATSASLEKAYRELQTTHALSVARIRELHGDAPLATASEEAANTMDLLLRSISDAEAERDLAQRQAEAYRLHAESLEEAERGYMGEEQSLATQLRDSARRVEELSIQIRQQLDSNNNLRQRLADAVGRGEYAQKASAARITEVQDKLKTLEDKVMSAQHHSEEIITQHEDEVRELNETHRVQMQLIKAGLLTPSKFSPTMPVSPLFLTKSPKLDITTSGLGITMAEATKADSLEKRVRELEKALGDADREMEEVVGRMNMAQIEVAELQTARDEAMRQTRRLQAQIVTERERFKDLIK